MRLVEIIHRPALDGDDRRDDAVRFVEAVTATTGRRPLSDHVWLDLRSGTDPRFVLVRVSDQGGTRAIAAISRVNDGVSLEIVVDPDLPDADAVRLDVADTALDACRRDGGRTPTTLTWWVDDATADERSLAVGFGLSPSRTLHEMRRALPIDERVTVSTRPFEPGRDDAAWLAVNNRAFASHAEQGGWTLATLALRLGEPWFDPDGFRIHERDGRVAGFCWTKIHDDESPVVGEIYVIAVDPDFHGLGLGRQLTLAGLESIWSRGVASANLYVDADNEAAISLYRRLGFEIERTRHAFTGLIR